MEMKYRIFDVKRRIYLDRNLYYVGQDGIIYKKSMPLPVRATNQENYEVRILVNDDEGVSAKYGVIYKVIEK